MGQAHYSSRLLSQSCMSHVISYSAKCLSVRGTHVSHTQGIRFPQVNTAMHEQWRWPINLKVCVVHGGVIQMTRILSQVGAPSCDARSASNAKGWCCMEPRSTLWNFSDRSGLTLLSSPTLLIESHCSKPI